MSDLYTNAKPVEDTTVSKKVIVAHQWNWNEFFHGLIDNLKRNLYLFIPILVVFFVGTWMQSPVLFRSEATSSSATVSLLPEFDTLPKEKTFQVWIRSEKKVTSVYLEVLFDPKTIRLSKEITLVDHRFTPISVSHPGDANTSGKIILSYKSNPVNATKTTPSSFRIADITFIPAAELLGQTTPVTFGDESNIQAVDGSWLSVKRFGSTYMLIDDSAIYTHADSLYP